METKGLIVVKLPEEHLAEFADGQMEAFKEAFPNDVVVFIPLEGEVLIGQWARAELIKLQAEITAAIERADNHDGIKGTETT